MKGDVRLRIEGLMPERLLQRAMRQGVRFKRVCRVNDRAVDVDTDEAGARVIAALCEKYGLPVSCLRRAGSSAILARLRRRRTLPAGVLVFVLLCWLFVTHIWRIDLSFTGEAPGMGSPEALRAALNALDIHPGISRRVDAQALSDALTAEAEGFGFIGARVEGVRLLIEAAPEVAAPELYDVQRPRDLYASRDGVVISAKAEAGELCVAPGDTIHVGQLLIRGEEKRTKEETQPIAALGQVIVRTWYAGEAALPLRETRRRETGRAAVASCVSLFDWEWPIADAPSFEDQRIEIERLPVGGLFLPIEINRETRRETESVEIEVPRESLAERLVPLAMADASAQLSERESEDFKIARSWIRYEIDHQSLRASAVLEIYADAAATLDELSAIQ